MTEFQRQIVEALKDNERMTTEEISEVVGRAEKSVYKALTYLRGAELVRDHQKAPPMEIPFTEEEHQNWLKRVEEWKNSGNPDREDRWELIKETEETITS